MISKPFQIRNFSLNSFNKYFASKQLLFGSAARKKLLVGCNNLAKAVEVTLGPGGRNVLIDQTYGQPKITKDGVTVAKSIEFADKAQNIGASLVKSVANKTNDEAGDGTTTATILARAIYQEALKKVDTQINPTQIKKGITLAVNHVVQDLKKRSTEIKGKQAISNVATISANGDRQIGNMIGQLYEKVGPFGTITCQQGKTLHHEVEFVDGLRFDRGYVSPYFVTDQKKQKIEYEGCYLLLIEKKVSNIQQLLPFIQFTHKIQKPLLIIAEDFESQVLGTLIINRLRSNLKICCVKSPSFGDNRKQTLLDIAAFSGGKYLSEDVGFGLENASQTPQVIKSVLGVAKNVTITKDDTILMHGQGDKQRVAERVDIISEQMRLSTSSYDKQKLEERLAKLKGGIGLIKVGGGSQVQVGEIKDRVTDALCATRAAISEGIVIGGGAALLYASKTLSSLLSDPKLSEGEVAGIRIIQQAIRIPVQLIARNAGFEGALVVAKLLQQTNENIGFNAVTGEYVNMKSTGIIDPTKVVKCALLDSSSVASMMMTTECIIFDEKQEKKN